MLAYLIFVQQLFPHIDLVLDSIMQTDITLRPSSNRKSVKREEIPFIAQAF